MKPALEPLLIEQLSFLPLGNLSGILQAWIQLKDFIIQQPSERHICQLLHDSESLGDIEERGEVAFFICCSDTDCVGHEDIGGSFQFLDLNPRNDKFHCNPREERKWVGNFAYVFQSWETIKFRMKCKPKRREKNFYGQDQAHTEMYVMTAFNLTHSKSRVFFRVSPSKF